MPRPRAVSNAFNQIDDLQVCKCGYWREGLRNFKIETEEGSWRLLCRHCGAYTEHKNYTETCNLWNKRMGVPVPVLFSTRRVRVRKE